MSVTVGIAVENLLDQRDNIRRDFGIVDNDRLRAFRYRSLNKGKGPVIWERDRDSLVVKL
jgi:hypothetical protein